VCVGNSRLLFAAACAFAGPLLRPAGIDSGGFHFRGDSSSGKTTALRVAASINGAPGYMQRWRTTDNALELTAAQHCDALLVLDELGQVDGKVAGECAYMLANESSKGRATRGAALRARLTWRLLFLSAGELGLSDHMAEAMKRARVGQEVRMVDLLADAGTGMGLFEELHGREGGAALATELSRATAAVYGAPGHAWLQWLAAYHTGLGKRLRERMDALRAAWVPEGASGQVARVAARFAIVAVAGELATEAGLTGWPVGEAEQGVRRCFESWLAQRGGTGNAEVRQMLRQVKRFIEVHGSGRFTSWYRAADDHSPKTLNRAGFWRRLGGDGKPVNTSARHSVDLDDPQYLDMADDCTQEYFVLAEVFRTEVCQGFNHEAVCRVLLEHDALRVEPGRLMVNVRPPGLGQTRCYHIKPALMALDV
jgi:putative DNA primase/helicase